MNALEPIQHTPAKTAPIFAHSGERLLSTIEPGELGIPVLKHLHHVWPHYVTGYVEFCTLSVPTTSQGRRVLKWPRLLFWPLMFELHWRRILPLPSCCIVSLCPMWDDSSYLCAQYGPAVPLAPPSDPTARGHCTSCAQAGRVASLPSSNTSQAASPPHQMGGIVHKSLFNCPPLAVQTSPLSF